MISTIEFQFRTYVAIPNLTDEKFEEAKKLILEHYSKLFSPKDMVIEGTHLDKIEIIKRTIYDRQKEGV